MHKNNAEDLLRRYHNGQVSEEEKAWVETWYLHMKTDDQTDELTDDVMEHDRQQSLDALLHDINAPRHTRLWPRLVAAAVIIMILAGIYALNHRQKTPQTVAATKPVVHDFAPGSNKVILTLSNGSKIELNDAKKGKVADEGGTLINKTADGQISYAKQEGADHLKNQQLFNTAATPRGGQYQLVLADGTRVWLNAASSVKYPVEFSGSERKVELTGEAYFEVAHDQKRPFRVVSNGQMVEVLGTHFNINAYDNEQAVKTTLLQGSVRIVAGANIKTIKPGEQAQLKHGQVTVNAVDTDEAVAWKNGFFNFNDADIGTVMRQLTRWYDLEVKYEGSIPQRQFTGEISRNVTARQILDILSFKKIHYRIDGNTIVITP
ncbi:FecR family protein [Mucilaginibacter sp. SG564]|uniref:FecR family protein n=1 Tax=Mucilaginibacter sp. SG564 TaxID=2587022 RepID=UPI001552E638|nr:FecR family protein [Mucilaginibacter sp. SG564]NOW98085.1 ferric-dicitrate binding protein FerR (iron transport regulator) [Mucilaginibacter sp. SG564]